MACDGNGRPDDPGRASDALVPIMKDGALRPDQVAAPRPAERWRRPGPVPLSRGEDVVIRWWREANGARPQAGELVARAPAMLLVGRLANSDIVLADETVSRLHAKISIVGDQVEITDMQSANGTVLDGRPIEHGVWAAGQPLRIGGFAFDLVKPGCRTENAAGDRTDAAPQALRLRVAVTHGNIVDRTADILALGLLDTIFASGAARDVNRASGDVVNTLYKSGRIDFRLGATTLIPVAQGSLSYDFMLLVGLGSADALGSSADAGDRKALVEGALHALGLYAFEYVVQFKLRSMATILSLAGAADDPGQLARQLIRGCLRSALGWINNGGEAPLPLITVCESDRERHGQILGALQEEAAALADPGHRAEILGTPATSMAVALEVAPEYAAGLPEQQTAAVPPPAPLEPVKLDVRALGQRAADGALEFELSCYRPAGYAYAETQRCVLSPDVLASQLPQIYDIHQPLEHRIRLTEAIFERLIPESIRRVIEEETRSRSLCVCLDAAVAMIPWEALMLGARPGTGRGISRMLRAAGRGGVRPILGALALPIDLLLVVNPTSDLPEADSEGERIARIAADRPECFNLTLLHGGEARKDRLIDALLRTRPHIMHFCGHGAFSLAKPTESGLICAGGDVLTGIDMYAINPMPNIVIFNACLSGRLIETEAGAAGPSAGAHTAAPMTSIAEAAIHGGVGSLIGTLWPVGDAAATTFSQIFYASLLDQIPVGDAVARGRAAILAEHPQSFDWANYVLYGDESQYLRPAQA